MTEKCADCRFWREDTHEISPLDDRYGWCRRNPPRVAGSIANAVTKASGPNDWLGAGALSRATLFPSTSFSDWCGQFELPPHRNPANLPIC